MTPADSPRAMIPLWPNYTPTPLRDFPRLAAKAGVARVLVKDEGARPLGSFKVLGGMYAGLRALTRALKLPNIAALMAACKPRANMPTLLCASDGNHGLAVAAGAELAGAAARVYLHERVPKARADRIAQRGAEIVWVPGTYDDAVLQAASAATRGEGLLIADTSDDPNDPVVADVMAGYGLMAEEIAEQLRTLGDVAPTHLFVQAGVGGLAAALAEGLHRHMADPRRIVVVEPERAACVQAALQAGRPVQLAGDLETAAEMLSCGLASSPALDVLLRHDAVGLAVSEAELLDAAAQLRDLENITTTPTGATGCAGLLRSTDALGIDARSQVILIVTEGPVPGTET